MTDVSRLALLRDVSAELAKPGAAHDTLGRAMRALVPAVMDHAILEVHESEGTVSHVPVFPTPELDALALEICKKYPPKPVAHPREVAIRTGEVTARDVSEDFLVSIAHDPPHLALLRRFGTRETLVLPLKAGTRSLGVLTAGTVAARRFTEEDRLVLELFAGHLAAHLDRSYFKRSVLLVEDNAMNRYLLKRVLLHAGFAVREASTGAEALQLAHEVRPDVAVLDVRLPDMLGFEVCRRLKADAFTASIPVIQMSASFVRPEDRIVAKEHGADDYLIAPIEPADLIVAVHSILRVAEARDEGRRTLERERTARRELERANAKLRAVVESGLLGTFEWDAFGTIVEANDALLALVGKSREDVLARALAVTDVVSSPIHRKDEVSTSGLVERELLGDGRTIPAILGVTLLEDRKSGVAFVLDVTEQRRRAELESLLLGMVSHDLRNPLGVVTMASSILMTQEMPELQRSLVRRIHSAGQRSGRLVSDLLDFTIARGAGIELSRDTLDLHDVVEQTIGDLRAFWPDRTMLHSKVGDTESFLDEDRIAQIATNLVGNALQHGPPTSPVEIVSRREGDAVVLSVHNGGKPIPADLLPELFAPLRRGADAGSRRGSLGLGLFIVKHLVAAHGGTIEVVSNEREGTTFTVRFPDVDGVREEEHGHAPKASAADGHADRSV